jgi:DNA ligase-1
VWASTDDPAPAESLYREALDRGHEGLMFKDPTAAYQPGRRVGRLLKLKPTMEPLDLVVTRAQYSEGRRRELLGRLFLGCYDPEGGELREVGRLSTGYTDEELRALTDRLEALVTARDGRMVELDAEVVLEIEYEEIQESPEYGSGYALRFPRFLGVREDLGPTDADTLDRVTSLYDSQ